MATNTITIPIEVPAESVRLLEALTGGTFGPDDVAGVIAELVDHAQQGVYRPGAWERGWLIQAFGDEFESRLQPDPDPQRAEIGWVVPGPAPESTEEESTPAEPRYAGDLFRGDEPVLVQLRRVSDGWGQPIARRDDPLFRVAISIARDLLAAGFELHDCGHSAPTGGVCLTPSPHEGGVMVTWAQHDVLAHHDGDDDLYDTHQDVQVVMNDAVADALTEMGWDVEHLDKGAGTAIIRRRLAAPEPGSAPQSPVDEPPPAS